MVKGLSNKIFGIFGILSMIYLTTPKKTEAVPISGFFINSPQCSVKVYRKPTGPIDTLKTKTDDWCGWVIETANFNPPAGTGETLYVYGGWNLEGSAKTFVIRGPPEYNSLDLNLNKHAACIKDVYDSTYFNSAPLKLIYWINGFPPETTQVDTGGQGLDHYYDIHAPFDTLQAVQGAQAHFRLEKVRADTTFYRNLDFVIDKTRFDAQLVRDTIYLTRDSFVIGVVEENLEKRVKGGRLIVKPNPAKNYIVSNYEAVLYDALGRQVRKIDEGKNVIDLNSGVYFIKREDDNDVKKLVILR